MNKITALEWAKALESGQYRQGKYKLKKESISHNEPEYCCLGVGLESAGVQSEMQVVHGARFYSFTINRGNGNDEPQETVQASCWLDDFLVEEDVEKFRATLLNQNDFVELNDIQGFNFKEIANKIREVVK